MLSSNQHLCAISVYTVIMRTHCKHTLQDSSVKETDSASKQTLIDLRKKTFAVASAHMTQVEKKVN